MAKNNNSTRFVVVAVALGIAGYGLFLLNKYLKGLQKPTDNSNVNVDTSFDWLGKGSQSSSGTGANNSSNNSQSKSNTTILKIGDKGAIVKDFQTVLNRIAEKTNDGKISVDGDFGKKTDTLYQKLSLNGTQFKPSVTDANRYLVILGDTGGSGKNTNFYYNPLDMATNIKASINVPWYMDKCAKSMQMCDTLKKVYGQGTEFLLSVGKEYQQRNDNPLSKDLNTYYNESGVFSKKCTCQTSPSGYAVQYSFEPEKIQSIIAQLKSANL